MQKMNDRQLSTTQYYIDKTEALEKGIIVFPSIYVEGAAASGKTTAVKMLLAKHPEVSTRTIDMKSSDEKILSELQSVENGQWIIFENISADISEGLCRRVRDFIETMPAENKVILVGRECPDKAFLPLLWKRQMQIISQDKLRLSVEDIRTMLEKSTSTLKAEDIYACTDGWAGCVDVMIRLSEGTDSANAKEIFERYEVQIYIEEEILNELSEQEYALVELANGIPWLNEQLCREVWGIGESRPILDKLTRKGILLHNQAQNRWQLSHMFQRAGEQDWLGLGTWYEMQGCLRDAISCLRKMDDKEAFFACLWRNYDKIPFLNISYAEVQTWNKIRPETCYLRGMHYYEQQNMDALKAEILKLCEWKPSDEVERRKKKEVLLNLFYVNPMCSLPEWLDLLEQNGEEEGKFRLYSILGNGMTFLCGIRDLSELFACKKREENHRARLWKEYLGEEEWKAYCLARMDYYMEIRQDDAIKDEDKAALDWVLDSELCSETSRWRFYIAGLYLYSRRFVVRASDEYKMKMEQLVQLLQKENDPVCIRNTNAIISLSSVRRDETECLTKWLRHANGEHYAIVNEQNYLEMCCRAQGYIFLRHYEKADKILQKVSEFLLPCKRSRLYAEVLFQQAIVNWEKNRHGQALKQVIESFLVAGNHRYVDFYTRYGKSGYAVLETYVNWAKQSNSEGWHKKKKYNYGNALRMPMEDYLELILRSAKRESKNHVEVLHKHMEERLTMMEIIMLQSLNRGLSNAEICKEQNLKMATVKSHIYSLYKKLDVNSRVQAVIKGKERGLI